ncbi:CPBP family intramembrane glutamic endopeptidase [Xylocopilactobacillus apis]|uniref:CAAX amino protease n=1 Tax=Xylocopilactobacillus apis TaxID=2932183 RepID=A0AAU9D718_9LACO|nr:type II CAAX endopeptidase family protein [Xylocopilactobacillus apis]BDR57205.1 CAAX amino protease [Xylocopilactobacillus apis]
MKKALRKIDLNPRLRMIFSIIAIALLMLFYYLQGSILSQAVKLKITEDETSYNQQIFLEVMYFVTFAILVLLALIVYFKLTRKKPFQKFTLRKIGTSTGLFIGSIVVQTVLGQLDYVINGNMQSANNSSIEEIAGLRIDFAVVLLSTAVLFSPIFEEVIYRGLIVDGVFKEHRLIGVFTQALLFGASHSVDNIIQFMTYFMTGLFLGLIYWKTENLEYSMIGHFLQNAIGALEMIKDLIS